MADSFGALPTLDSTINPSADAAALDKSSADIGNMAAKNIQSFQDQAADINSLNQNVRTTHQRFGMALDGLMDKVTGAQADINDAYDKMSKAHHVPPGFANILALFGDHDYDIDYQKDRINKASTDLELANQQVQTLGTAAQNAERAATFAREGATAALNTSMAVQGNERANIGAKIALQNQSVVMAQRQVEGMTDAQLAQAVKNPDLVTKNNPNITPGMIQDAFNNRKSAQLSLETAGAVLRGTNIQNDARAMELYNAQIQNHLAHISMSDFQNEASVANKQGYFEKKLPDGTSIKIPNIMYNVMARQREEAAIQFGKNTQDFRKAQVDAAVLQPQVESQYARVASDSQMRSFIPPEDMTAIQTDYAAAKSLENSQDPGSVMQRAAILHSLNDRINKFAEQAIAAAPKEAQSGKKQYFQSGEISDMDAANGVLIASTKNVTSPLDASKNYGSPDFPVTDPYAAADGVLRANVFKLRDAANYPFKALVGNMGTGGGGIGGLSNLPKQKPSDSDLFQKSLQAPVNVTVTDPNTGAQSKHEITVGANMKAMATKQYQEIALHNAILYLAGYSGDKKALDTPGMTDFKELVSGGEVDPFFRTPDGHIDANKVINFLAKKDLSGNGAQNIRAMIGVLNSPTFRKEFNQFDKTMFTGPVHASYRRMLFNNDPASYTISQLVSRLRMVQMQSQNNPTAVGAPPYPVDPLKVRPVSSFFPTMSDIMPDMSKYPYKFPAKFNARAGGEKK